MSKDSFAKHDRYSVPICNSSLVSYAPLLFRSFRPQVINNDSFPPIYVYAILHRIPCRAVILNQNILVTKGQLLKV